MWIDHLVSGLQDEAIPKGSCVSIVGHGQSVGDAIAMETLEGALDVEALSLLIIPIFAFLL